VAWIVALAGTLALAAETTRTAGEIAIVVAGVLAVIAWGSVRAVPAFAAPRSAGRWVPGRRHLLCLGGMALAAALTWAADARFLAGPAESFGVPGWLWLAAMGVLLAAALAWPRPVPVGGGVSDPAPEPVPRRAVLVDAAILAGITVLAVGTRVWDLAALPFAIHSDEILTGRLAYQYYIDGQATPIFSTVWTDINLPALWFWLVGLSLQLGGGSLAALRLPAALFGAATVIPFYGLVRMHWGRAAAIAGSVILAVSASNVHYSRVTLNNIVTPFFWAVCFYFLLRGLRTRRPVDWVLAGFAGGLSEYGYYGTHLLPFILLAFATYLLVIHRRQALRYLGHFGWLVLGYITAFGPLLAYYTQHLTLYFGRGASVLMWDHIPRDWADLQLMWNTLWPLLAENLLGISTHPSQDSVYWAPLLLPAEAALLVLGVALLIRRWRQPAAFLLLLVGGGVLFVGGTLVHGVPFLAHWTPAFPAFYAALAVPVGVWAGSWPQGARARRLRLAGIGTLALGLGALVWLNVDFYFNQYQATRPEFELPAAEGRWAAGLGSGYQVYSVGRTWQPYNPELMRYLAPDQVGAALDDPASALPLPAPPGKGLAFFFLADNQQYQAPVQALYPGGTTGEVHSHGGVHLFNTYVVPPARVAAAYGVTLELAAPDGSYHWTGRVRWVGQWPPEARGPLSARWTGALYLPHAGLYHINVNGPPAQVAVDGRPMLPGGRQLGPGWHPFTVQMEPAPLAAPALQVSEGSGPAAPVSPDHLWPVTPALGK
jgi:4-amino-4-deoxy-L-arabinose transferase-like glycosyltransferase